MGLAEIFRVCYLECLLYPICLVTALAFEVFHTCLNVIFKDQPVKKWWKGCKTKCHFSWFFLKYKAATNSFDKKIYYSEIW